MPYLPLLIGYKLTPYVSALNIAQGIDQPRYMLTVVESDGTEHELMGYDTEEEAQRAWLRIKDERWG